MTNLTLGTPSKSNPTVVDPAFVDAMMSDGIPSVQMTIDNLTGLMAQSATNNLDARWMLKWSLRYLRCELGQASEFYIETAQKVAA